MILVVCTLMLCGTQLMAQDSKSTAPNESELTKLLIPKGPATTFKQHLAKTQVSDAVLRKLETMRDPGPIILLNFVRWRPDRDPTSYMKYGKVAVSEQGKEGAWQLFAGPAIHDLDAAYGFDNSWDEIAAPLYRRRAAYGVANASAAYQAAVPDRVAGTYQRHLYSLVDGEQLLPAALTIQRVHDKNISLKVAKGEVIIGEFLRFKKSGGKETYRKYGKAIAPLINKAGGKIVLSVDCELPVVSEELWDHFVMTRYPSMKAYEDLFKTDRWIEASRLRRAALDASMAGAFQAE
jgi:uncharacterized protein (DUF1330 family)